jgi:hypothetical protein
MSYNQKLSSVNTNNHQHNALYSDKVIYYLFMYPSSVLHDSIVGNKVTHGVGSQGSVPSEVHFNYRISCGEGQ